MIEVGVLGELRVVVDGIDVTPAARKERAMLALIAIEPGRVMSTSRLLEELWPDLPPERGRHACQVRVAEIRKHLARAGAGRLLESVAPGYRLAIDPEAVDARRFATLVEDGRARTAAGDPTGAAETLREALALWRGEAFADALGSPALDAEAARREEARLGAVEARIAAELADGCYQQLVPELDALVAAQPLREGLWEHRVLALYRCGRQAEALRACAAIRDRLRDELGVDPGPGLRDMEAAVLAHSPTLDWHPAEPAASPHPTDAPTQLVRSSTTARATSRYRLLETLRHYALDRLADAGETETLGRRHAEWYARHAAEYSAVRSPEEALWLARGLAELDNFRGAVAFAVENDDIDLAVRLVGPLWSLTPCGIRTSCVWPVGCWSCRARPTTPTSPTST